MEGSLAFIIDLNENFWNLTRPLRAFSVDSTWGVIACVGLPQPHTLPGLWSHGSGGTWWPGEMVQAEICQAGWLLFLRGFWELRPHVYLSWKRKSRSSCAMGAGQFQAVCGMCWRRCYWVWCGAVSWPHGESGTKPTWRAVDADSTLPPWPPQASGFPSVSNGEDRTCCVAGGIRNRARIVQANATNTLTSKTAQHFMLQTIYAVLNSHSFVLWNGLRKKSATCHSSRRIKKCSTLESQFMSVIHVSYSFSW